MAIFSIQQMHAKTMTNNLLSILQRGQKTGNNFLISIWAASLGFNQFLALLIAVLFFQTSALALESVEISPPELKASPPELQLTDEEKNWLKQHDNIRIGFDGSLPPYSFTNDKGEIDGIAFEVMSLLMKRLGLHFESIQDPDWINIYKAGAKHKIDIVATMVNRPERNEWFNFTKPYLTKSLVIVIQTNNPNIGNRNDLADKKVAVVNGYQYADEFEDELPNATPYKADSLLESLQLVSTNQADAAIIFLGTANYLIAKYQLDSLKVVAFYERNSANESMAVRKDWPILAEVLQKTLDSIPVDELQHIFSKWIVGTPITPIENSSAQTGKNTSPLSPPLEERDQKTKLYSKLTSALAKIQTNIGEVKLILLAVVLILLLLLLWSPRTKKRKKQPPKSDIPVNIPKKEGVLVESSQQQTPSTPLENLSNDSEANPIEVKSTLQLRTEHFARETISYRHDIDGRFSFVSPSVTNLLGYSVADFMTNFRNYLTENPVNRLVDNFMETYLQGHPNKPYEIEIFDSENARRWLKVIETPIYDGMGHFVGIDGTLHDITAEKLYTELKGEQTDNEGTLDSLQLQSLPAEPSQYQRLFEQLAMTINAADKNQDTFALVYLTLERIRELDGNIPSCSLDDVLIESLKRLQATLRSTDLVFNLNVDCFAIILTETDLRSLNLIVDKIRNILQIPYVIGMHSIILDANIGAAGYPGNSDDVDSLLQEAKMAASFGIPYEAVQKQNAGLNTAENVTGDDGFQFQRDLLTVLDACKISLRTSSRQNINALNRFSQFGVYYQSRHSSEDYSIRGFEALIRWQHPKMGTILPNEFIPLVKELGMLDIMTYWFVQQVSFQALAWENQEIRPNLLTINLDDLSDSKAVDITKVIAIINETGAKTEWFEFSIPEKDIVKNPDKVIPLLKQIADSGITLAIDNFGADSRLLEQIDKIPAQIIEIDPEFIRNLPRTSDTASIILDTIRMLHDLGKTVVGKEIETEQELNVFKQSECDIVQGHLLSRPLPAAEAKNLMKSLPDFIWYFQQD